MVLGGKRLEPFATRTPARLRWARTCYDHMAGTLAVLLHDYMLGAEWIAGDMHDDLSYELTTRGVHEFAALGVDAPSLQSGRRRLVYPCLDWSERRPHVGGAVGAALLKVALQRKWVVKDLDSRVVRVTKGGAREFAARFGVTAQS
jgi:hypothetical protein